jgi:DNA-binding NarL/FixJ family response regulator
VISVVIADDEALVRDGLRSILELDDEFEVLGEASDGLEAVRQVRELHPDVVLMDVRMPELDGIEATRRIAAAAAGTKVVVLTTFDRNEYVYRAMKAGASAFLLKDVRRGELTRAIHNVVAGDVLVAATTTRRLIEEYCRVPEHGSDQPQALSALTPRELEVMRLMGQGLSNGEIAASLVVAETTVKTHVARILAKYHLRDRTQAVVLAYETGLVRPGGLRSARSPGPPSRP